MSTEASSDNTPTGGISFSNEVDVQQANTSYTKKTSTELADIKHRKSLTMSAKAWDLDGDGELDDAELALKEMDKSHKGTLSKEQMYKLMSDNLQTQRELFKVKKVVIGLVVFTCILAVSNLGTSLAAAFLAKDTTSTDDQLTDAKSGRTLGTQSTNKNFDVDKDFHEDFRRRRMNSCATSGGQTKETLCTFTGSWTAVPASVGDDIVKSCNNGNTVSISVSAAGGADSPHTICPVNDPTTVEYKDFTGQGKSPRHMNIIGTNAITVKPDPADSDTSIITGLVSLATIGLTCFETSDCVSGLVCEDHGAQGKVCKGTEMSTCFDPLGATGDLCSAGFSCAVDFDQTTWKCHCAEDAACGANMQCVEGNSQSGGGLPGLPGRRLSSPHQGRRELFSLGAFNMCKCTHNDACTGTLNSENQICGKYCGLSQPFNDCMYASQDAFCASQGQICNHQSGYCESLEEPAPVGEEKPLVFP